MEILENKESEYCVGKLVSHRHMRRYPPVGLIMNIRKITSGWDIEVYWSQSRISNHHSNCLEIV